jgi:hypothetical protein
MRKPKLTPWSRALLEKLIGIQLVKIFQLYMEFKGSLLCSQDSAIGPCPEPGKSSPMRRPSYVVNKIVKTLQNYSVH